MTTPDTDRVAATLAGIRERFETVTEIPLEALPLEPEQAAAFAALVMDTPSLLAAVEAALKAAGDWDAEAVRLDQWAARLSAEGGMIVPAAQRGRAEAHRGCAQVLRGAITAALTGTQLSEDGSDHG